jgi:AbiJ N-terminal domain 4
VVLYNSGKETQTPKGIQMSRFSARHGLGGTAAPIKIRNAAPEEMRGVVLDIAYELGLSPSPMRALLCKLLRKRANPTNWSEWPNVARECEDLIQQCEWYEVYDAMEEIFQRFQKSEFYDSKHGPMYKAQCFADEVNRYLHREGIGWQLNDGEIVTRGTEIFESAVRGAAEALESVQRSTARDEFHEALIDLSRRPEPDLTGAIQHAMAALECVARDACGDPKATLGEIIKRYPGVIPKPLDESVAKAWGYASEMARHIREGRRPERPEVELIVGLAATVATYLSRNRS